MKISVVQFYVESGAGFEFTHRFQSYISARLSELIPASESFSQKYGIDFFVTFYMSANSGITTADVKGPNVYKKDKEVEFVIFLPFRPKDEPGPARHMSALREFLHEIVCALNRIGLDASRLATEMEAIVDEVLNDSTMIRSVPT